MWGKSLLLILDNVSEALIKDGSNFKKIISSLLDECALLKILVCSERRLIKVENHYEHCIDLQGFNGTTSCSFLLKRVKRKISQKEIYDLCKSKIPSNHSLRKIFPFLEDKIDKLVNHPLIHMTGGHPLAL